LCSVTDWWPSLGETLSIPPLCIMYQLGDKQTQFTDWKESCVLCKSRVNDTGPGQGQ